MTVLFHFGFIVFCVSAKDYSFWSVFFGFILQPLPHVTFWHILSLSSLFHCVLVIKVFFCDFACIVKFGYCIGLSFVLITQSITLACCEFASISLTEPVLLAASVFTTCIWLAD